MDYQTATIRTIKGCPDEWETEQIEYYLYETLGYRSSDIYYMCGEAISHTEDTYVPQPEKPTPYKKWTEIKEKHPDCLFCCFSVSAIITSVTMRMRSKQPKSSVLHS